MNAHRYFKRRWDESRGDQFDAWGPSLWFFELDSEAFPVRQVERYENGVVLKYDTAHLDDEYGGLGDQALNLADFDGAGISREEFEAASGEPRL